MTNQDNILKTLFGSTVYLNATTLVDHAAKIRIIAPSAGQEMKISCSCNQELLQIASQNATLDGLQMVTRNLILNCAYLVMFLAMVAKTMVLQGTT